MSEVREGFLCPICMSDLGDEIQLQVHFEERHSKEDPIFLQSIKDLFGKAKKKILNQDSDQESTNNFFSFGLETAKLFGPISSPAGGGGGIQHDPVTGVPLSKIRDLPRPKIVDYTPLFKEERTKRLERNKSTNQIMIRLEKLMTNLPSDPGKRRTHEQAVVPWIEEDLVKQCPNCAERFNIARRKHHCRLCGSIMCNACSRAVSFEFARKVINPATISRFQNAPESQGQEVEQQAASTSKLGGLFKAKNASGSHENLNSLMNLMDLKVVEEQFRSCPLCLDILMEQDSKVEKAMTEPMLVQFYDRLQLHIGEGREMSASYRKMSESLSRGEEDYSLSEAKFLRIKILKIAENVDIISKKISVLDTDSSGQPGFVSGLQLQLQQMIRASAVNFVKEGLVGLPGLPSEEDFEVLKQRRRENAERKVAEEKQAAKLAKLRFEQDSAKRSPRLNSSNTESPTHSGTAKGIKHSNGLVLSSSNYTCSSDDPMVQQIHNIQEFIKEARRLGKFDEVGSLEANLKELQAEYQKGQKELVDNYALYKGLFHKTSPMKEGLASSNNDGQQHESGQDFPEDEYDSSGKNPFL